MSSQPQITLPEEPLSELAAVAAGGSRAAQWALLLAFLIILGGVPLVQLGLELHRHEAPKALDVLREKPTAVHLRAYENRLETASVFAGTLRPLVQFAQFAWLRDGGEKALIGREGWLFYRPGFDAMVGTPLRLAGDARTNDPLPAILAFRNELAARGTHLLVVIAPNKESVYPDRLTARAQGTRSLRSTATMDLLARLQAAQVPTVDLFELFAQARQGPSAADPGPLYLAQDSHWSPAGVRLGAQAVAERVLQLGWSAMGSVAYSERSVVISRIGDVLRMLQAPLLEQRTVPESVACGQVLLGESGEKYQDDPNSPILVLGDSFLRIYQQDEPGSAGFIAHLAKELRQPLTSLVSDGGASTLVRQELSRRPSLLRNKTVVIWEFVERDIRLGAEGWQTIPLPGKLGLADGGPGQGARAASANK